LVPGVAARLAMPGLRIQEALYESLSILSKAAR
jgi:hypothetical protein